VVFWDETRKEKHHQKTRNENDCLTFLVLREPFVQVCVLVGISMVHASTQCICIHACIHYRDRSGADGMWTALHHVGRCFLLRWSSACCGQCESALSLSSVSPCASTECMYVTHAATFPGRCLPHPWASSHKKFLLSKTKAAWDCALLYRHLASHRQVVGPPKKTYVVLGPMLWLAPKEMLSSQAVTLHAYG
jgi:hypothetical protein